MQRTPRFMFLCMLLAMLAGWAYLEGPVRFTSVALADSPQAISVGESPDFATLELRDPWDMSQFSDISQYLNESGQRRVVRDVRVENGIFSGVSIGTAATGDNAYFFPYFPGYERTIKPGRVGHNFPVASSEYQCLYFAMKVDSGPANFMGPDQFVVYWFEDDRLVQRGGDYGVTSGVALYPEAGAGQPVQGWRLYRVDLANPANGLRPDTTARWNERPLWRGIRIDPTINSGVKFAVDWVRLTSCTPDLHTVEWTPNPAANALWIKAEGSQHHIRVAINVNGASGSHNLDIQGIAPGKYTVSLGTTTTCCVQENVASLTIYSTPIIEFSRPSVTSGEDYYTALTGKPWNFERANDIVETQNFPEAPWIANNQLHIKTPAGPLPSGIIGQIYFNLPTPIDTREYRYLTYRMYAEWVSPWQDVTSGMISRWVWIMPSLTGVGGYECHLVTQDVPFDVGWNVYTVDLHDWFGGAPEDQYPTGLPHCPPLPSGPADEPPSNISQNPAHWLNTGPVHRLRFTPNENVSCEFGRTQNPVVPCGDYYQILDWVMLTKADTISRGDQYPVMIQSSGADGDVSFNYFYSSNQANPRQHAAQSAVRSTATAPKIVPANLLNAVKVFVPMVQRSRSPNEPDFVWDTSAVQPGTYYLCVEATTPFTSVVHCSDVPVHIN